MGLKFDGKDISNGFRINGVVLPLHVELKPDYSFPEREYISTHVPGRNGDILEDVGSYPNTQLTYLISCGRDYDFDYLSIARQIKDWLTANSGYRILEDSYEPDIFRFACFRSACVVNRITENGARIQLTFDAKPQKYYKEHYPPPEGTGSGIILLQNRTSFSGSINSPFQEIAKPLIEISSSVIGISAGCDFVFTYPVGTGIGTIRLQTQVPVNKTMYIDCELEEVYDGDGNNIGESIILLDNKFPVLTRGITTYTVTAQQARTVKLYTRYWTL